MSSESSKKRKPKVIRSDGAPTEGKRNRSDTEQVRLAKIPCCWETADCGRELPVSVEELRVMCTRDILLAHTRPDDPKMWDQNSQDVTKDERLHPVLACWILVLHREHVPACCSQLAYALTAQL